VSQLALAPAELEQITGRVQPQAQAKWLNENGWVYVMSGAGRPLVSRRYAEARLEGRGENTNAEPDFSAIA
jgi:hypothetical protein